MVVRDANNMRGSLGWGVAAAVVAGAVAGWMLYVWPAVKERNALRVSMAELEQTKRHQAHTIAKLEAELLDIKTSTAELSADKAIAEQALAAMRRTQEELKERLKEEVNKGNVLIEEMQGEIVVDLIDKVVFDSGQAELNDKGKEVLREVGETLKKVPDKIIQIAGHTDNDGISKNLIEQFPTNWELSTARATNVVRFLQEEVKVPGKRLAAVGFAEYQPIGNNRTKAGKRKNRRIEVRLIPALEKRER